MSFLLSLLLQYLLISLSVLPLSVLPGNWAAIIDHLQYHHEKEWFINQCGHLPNNIYDCTLWLDLNLASKLKTSNPNLDKFYMTTEFSQIVCFFLFAILLTPFVIVETRETNVQYISIFWILKGIIIFTFVNYSFVGLAMHI